MSKSQRFITITDKINQESISSRERFGLIRRRGKSLVTGQFSTLLGSGGSEGGISTGGNASLIQYNGTHYVFNDHSGTKFPIILTQYNSGTYTPSGAFGFVPNPNDSSFKALDSGVFLRFYVNLNHKEIFGSNNCDGIFKININGSDTTLLTIVNGVVGDVYDTGSITISFSKDDVIYIWYDRTSFAGGQFLVVDCQSLINWSNI